MPGSNCQFSSCSDSLLGRNKSNFQGDLISIKSIISIPECGGSEKPGRLSVVVDVRDGADGVVHLVVHDGVHVHSHGVFCQDLEGTVLLSKKLAEEINKANDRQFCIFTVADNE